MGLARSMHTCRLPPAQQHSQIGCFQLYASPKYKTSHINVPLNTHQHPRGNHCRAQQGWTSSEDFFLPPTHDLMPPAIASCPFIPLTCSIPPSQRSCSDQVPGALLASRDARSSFLTSLKEQMRARVFFLLLKEWRRPGSCRS